MEIDTLRTTVGQRGERVPLGIDTLRTTVGEKGSEGGGGGGGGHYIGNRHSQYWGEGGGGHCIRNRYSPNNGWGEGRGEGALHWEQTLSEQRLRRREGGRAVRWE